jgi:hypothetical protein
MSPIFSCGLTGAPIRRELGFAASLEAIPLSATWGEIMSRKVLLAGASALAILVAAGAAEADSFTIPGMYSFTVA